MPRKGSITYNNFLNVTQLSESEATNSKNITYSAMLELLKEKKMDYSPDVIANLSKEGKIKGAEASIGTNAIYRAVEQRKDFKCISHIHMHRMKEDAMRIRTE